MSSPSRATTLKRPITNNTASGDTIRTSLRFYACGSVVGVCPNRHRNRFSGRSFIRWSIVWNQDLHIADITYHEARDAHQQRHATKQHKHDSHVNATAAT